MVPPSGVRTTGRSNTDQEVNSHEIPSKSFRFPPAGVLVVVLGFYDKGNKAAGTR